MTEIATVFLTFLVLIGLFIGWLALLFWCMSEDRIVLFLVCLILGLSIGATAITIGSRAAAEAALHPPAESLEQR